MCIMLASHILPRGIYLANYYCGNELVLLTAQKVASQLIMGEANSIQ